MPRTVVESVLSHTPTVSADGRWVAYAGVRALRAAESVATTEVDEKQEDTIWLKDRENDVLIDLTPSSASLRLGRTVWPVISGDGCTLTVITELALDLFRDDDLGNRWDVYRLLLPHCDGEPGDWELVSATDGSGFDVTAGDNASPLYPPAVSADGNRVAYTHEFDPLVADVLGVTVVDLTIAIGEPGRSLAVAGTPEGAPNSTYRYRGQREPAISADGNVLAFTSDAVSDAPVPEWGVGLVEGGFAVSNVYVWDRTPPAVDAALDPALDPLATQVAAPTPAADTIVAISTVTAGATGDATSPALSGNGRFVAFVSTANNLIPGATLPPCGEVCLPQVYLFDRVGNSLSLASREPGDPASPPIAADGGATQPALNYGGEELLFVSRSNNLFPTRSQSVGDANDGDIVLALPALGTVDRVSVLADGITPAPAANAHPRLSAVGRVIVFDTLAGAVYGTPQVGRQVAVVDHSPSLVLSDLDVGTVEVWFPGPEWFLVLANNGPSSFLPVTATVDNEDFLISGGSCLEQAAAVAPGATCTIKLMLLPTVAGERKATLTVSEEGFNAVSISAQLTGRGGAPSLAPTPAGGYAGSVLVGSSSIEPLSFEMANVSFGRVNVKSIAVEGANPGDFAVTTDTCSGTKLAPGATSCDLQVVFTPTAGGRRSAQVVVTTGDGGYATILLSGDAFYDPLLAVDRSTLPAGSRLTVTGSGFAPNSPVTVSWADGSGGSATAVTDAAGGLSTQLVVRATDRTGQRTLVAQGVDQGADQVATVDVLILAPGNNRGPSSPAWPGA
ncbi:MAG: choice-of-anchor D domain-containing protein [Actinomycetia bacterium]|nr:choice-of-anchor D domain-containing protein [Actinomycetes bacterium]